MAAKRIQNYTLVPILIANIFVSYFFVSYSFVSYSFVSYISLVKMETPFSFGKIVSHPDFTDREKETAWREQQIMAKNNCMIISPRR